MDGTGQRLAMPPRRASSLLARSRLPWTRFAPDWDTAGRAATSFAWLPWRDEGGRRGAARRWLDVEPPPGTVIISEGGWAATLHFAALRSLAAPRRDSRPLCAPKPGPLAVLAGLAGQSVARPPLPRALCIDARSLARLTNNFVVARIPPAEVSAAPRAARSKTLPDPILASVRRPDLARRRHD